MNKKKSQHYVWREYLRAWANNEQIWTCRKESKTIFKSNLTGVAQENYFYRLVDLEPDEEAFIKLYIETTSSAEVKQINLVYLSLFTSITKLKKDESLYPHDKRIKNLIEEQEANLMEDYHGIVEGYGDKLIKCKTIEDVKAIATDEHIVRTLLFMWVQFFRTKNIKNRINRFLPNENQGETIKKGWNIISYVLATNLAYNMSQNPALRFTLLENKTKIPFITCDQPIYNFLQDERDEKGKVLEFEFYYPLSPITAIQLHFNPNQKERFNSISLSEEKVDFYNKSIAENADSFLFASSEEDIEAYKQFV